MKRMTDVVIEKSEQKLYTMKGAAALLGLTVPAVRSQTWRGRIRTVKLGRRTLISADEIARIQGLSS
jgi:excisionase family DNA binding protein